MNRPLQKKKAQGRGRGGGESLLPLRGIRSGRRHTYIRHEKRQTKPTSSSLSRRAHTRQLSQAPPSCHVCLSIYRIHTEHSPSAAVWSMPHCRVLWFFSINYLRKKKHARAHKRTVSHRQHIHRVWCVRARARDSHVRGGLKSRVRRNTLVITRGLTPSSLLQYTPYLRRRFCGRGVE